MIALVLAGAVVTAALIPWAVRMDAADAHTLHTTGCVDCAAEDEWLGL